jgi:hypothetical protein
MKDTYLRRRKYKTESNYYQTKVTTGKSASGTCIVLLDDEGLTVGAIASELVIVKIHRHILDHAFEESSRIRRY